MARIRTWKIKSNVLSQFIFPCHVVRKYAELLDIPATDLRNNEFYLCWLQGFEFVKLFAMADDTYYLRNKWKHLWLHVGHYHFRSNNVHNAVVHGPSFVILVHIPPRWASSSFILAAECSPTTRVIQVFIKTFSNRYRPLGMPANRWWGHCLRMWNTMRWSCKSWISLRKMNASTSYFYSSSLYFQYHG